MHMYVLEVERKVKYVWEKFFSIGVHLKVHLKPLGLGGWDESDPNPREQERNPTLLFR